MHKTGFSCLESSTLDTRNSRTMKLSPKFQSVDYFWKIFTHPRPNFRFIEDIDETNDWKFLCTKDRLLGTDRLVCFRFKSNPRNIEETCNFRFWNFWTNRLDGSKIIYLLPIRSCTSSGTLAVTVVRRLSDLLRGNLLPRSLVVDKNIIQGIHCE